MPFSFVYGEQASDVVKLIGEAKGYIETGNKEEAVNTLNIAFDLASSLGDDKSLMEKIKGLTKKLIEIGRDQGSFTLLAKTNILRSKLALVEGDVDEARILLAQAHVTAQEKGLHLLARKINHEQELLQSQLDKWEKIFEKKSTGRISRSV